MGFCRHQTPLPSFLSSEPNLGTLPRRAYPFLHPNHSSARPQRTPTSLPLSIPIAASAYVHGRVVHDQQSGGGRGRPRGLIPGIRIRRWNASSPRYSSRARRATSFAAAWIFHLANLCYQFDCTATDISNSDIFSSSPLGHVMKHRQPQ